MTNEKAVPLVDLSSQYSSIKNEVDSAIADVIDRAAFIGGAECERFESDFAEYCEAKHAVGVGNGTDALFLALKALGIGPGDEVIVPVNTFIATSEAVTAVGATPVFVDVNPDTALIETEHVEQAVTPCTVAIIPVHLYGRAVDMDAMMALAQRHGMAVIEDAAQAHGSRWNGRRVGSWGHIACFSFYPGKNLGAYGDAGAVVTSDETLSRRVRLLKNHGRDQKYIHGMEGYNSRMDTLQAAILSVKLKYLDRWNEARQRLAETYREAFEGLQPALRMLAPARPEEHVYHLFVVRCEDRDRLQEALKSQRIATGIHYPVPLHLQPAYAAKGHKEGDYPGAEYLAGRILSLPIYAEMTIEQQERVCGTLQDAL